MELNTIKSPELTATNFGEGVAQVFNQIDENFRRVSSYDFIKGEDGRSLNIVKHYFQNDIQSGQILKNSISEAIFNALYNIPGITKESLSSINNITIYDNFLKNNAGYILLIYNDNKDNQTRDNWKEGLCGCIPYTFIDPRFSSLSVNDNNIEKWNIIIDCSCIITWSNDSFIPVQSFPTLYYDSDQNQFCWKISDKKTGLIARGPAGEDGKSGNFIICLVRRSEEASGIEGTVKDGTVNLNGVYPIAYYLTGSTDNAVNLEGNMWIEVENLNPDWIGCNAIVFETTAMSGDPDVSAVDGSKIYWVSNIGQRSIKGIDKCVVNLSNSNAITSDIDTNAFLAVLNNLTNLYIPMKLDNNISSTEPVHMVAADQMGVYNLKNALILGPASRSDKTDDLLQKIKVYYIDSNNQQWILETKPIEEPTDESNPFKWVNEQSSVNNDTLLPSDGCNMIFEPINEISKDKIIGILYNIAILGDLNITSVSGKAIMTDSEIETAVTNVINNIQ